MQTPRPAQNRSKTSASKLCFTDFVRRSHGCGTISRFHIDKRSSVRDSRRPASIDHRRAPGPGVSRGDRHDRGRPLARSRARYRVGGRAAAGEPRRRVLRARARGQPGCRNGARRARHRRAGSRRRNRGRLEGRGRRARPQSGRREHALGDARAAEDRPHRLPVADRALHRPRGGVSLRADEGCPRRGKGTRRDALRHPRRPLLARRRALQLRRVPEALSPERPGARAARRHRARSGYRAAGSCAAGAGARRDLARAVAQLRRRSRDAKSRHGDVRRALCVVQVGAGRGSHLESCGVPLNGDRAMNKALAYFISTFVSVAAMTTTHAETFTFDRDAPGALPAGWRAGVTGRGSPKWSVEADATAPSKPNVLKQPGSGFFPWCVRPDVSLENGYVEVKFKPLSGKEDQAGGLVWRWKDGDNYYVARANALENNVSLYYTVNARRNTIKYVDAPVAKNQWHTLRVEFAAKRNRVSLDGKLYIEVDDTRIAGAGAVGVWTKADSVTSFDDFAFGP